MRGCNCPITDAGPTLADVCGGGQIFIFMAMLDAMLRNQCDIADPCGQPKVCAVYSMQKLTLNRIDSPQTRRSKCQTMRTISLSLVAAPAVR